MSSILTNNSAMTALTTMRNINNSLDSTQNRISTGLKVNSAKDNAAYFAISESMKGDSGMLKSINEGLTLTKNSVSTARLGAENFQKLANQFVDRLSFAQGATGGLKEIESELKAITDEMDLVIQQSTFNGDDLVNAVGDTTGVTTGTVTDTNGTLTLSTPLVSTEKSVVTGISRSNGFGVTETKFNTVDLSSMLGDFKAIVAGYDTDGDPGTGAYTGGLDGFDASVADASAGSETYLENSLLGAEQLLGQAITAATDLGVAEKTLENQQEFLNKLTDNLDAGVGAMVDANMEEEAARLQALQVQQQLATQSLTMANQKPQNILGLFR